jgi:hypothetical protein
MGARQRGREGEGEGGHGYCGPRGHGERLLLEEGLVLHCCSESLFT